MGISRQQAEQFMKRVGIAPGEVKKRLSDDGGWRVQKLAQTGISHQARAAGYGAKKTHSDLIGRGFHSDGERRCAERLWAIQQAGRISGLTFQPRVKVLNIWAMVPDFRYLEDGRIIHHEYKGYEDDRWKMQVKVWQLLGPTEYRVSFERKPDLIIVPRPSDELIAYVLDYVKANS